MVLVQVVTDWVFIKFICGHNWLIFRCHVLYIQLHPVVFCSLCIVTCWIHPLISEFVCSVCTAVQYFHVLHWTPLSPVFLCEVVVGLISCPSWCMYSLVVFCQFSASVPCAELASCLPCWRIVSFDSFSVTLRRICATFIHCTVCSFWSRIVKLFAGDAFYCFIDESDPYTNDHTVWGLAWPWHTNAVISTRPLWLWLALVLFRAVRMLVVSSRIVAFLYQFWQRVIVTLLLSCDVASLDESLRWMWLLFHALPVCLFHTFVC